MAQQAWRIEGLWSLHLYRYSADLSVAGQRAWIEPGHAGFTPPGAIAAYRFDGLSTHLYAHLEFPKDAETRDLPLVFPVGPKFGALWAQTEEAIGLFPTDRRRAEVRIWDVWLSVLDAAGSIAPDVPPSVRRALELIEQRLHEPLTVADIAKEVCLSHNHLTRLFRRTTGQTVIEAIQKRRMERARHLLRFTDLPVKQIATMVGIDDLQRFNKAVRRYLGDAPTRLRT